MPERFHWIVPSQLAAMALPGLARPIGADLQEIYDAGVRAVATLTERPLPDAARAASTLAFRHFPIVDFDVPTLEQVQEFCAWTDERIAAKEPVAVHCFAGLGRTGTMIACWLVRDEKRTPERVLWEMRRLEPGYVQTAEQEAFITVWQDSLRRRRG